MESYIQPIFDYLTHWGPTVVILAIGGWVLYGMYCREREENNELHNYIREADIENLKLLNDFSALLENITNINESNTQRIIQEIKQSAAEIKTHVDDRVHKLEAKK